MTSGSSGSLTSMMCTPSWPRSGSGGAAGSRNIGQSPQKAPGCVNRSGSVTGISGCVGLLNPPRGAGVGEFHERKISDGRSAPRRPQAITSPWLPTVFVGLAQSSQLMISSGSSGSSMSIMRKPEYVPWIAVSPQNARSELNTPCLGLKLSSGTFRAEYPIGSMLSVKSNVAVARSTLLGPDDDPADASSGTARTPIATSTTTTVRRDARIPTSQVREGAGRRRRASLRPSKVGGDRRIRPISLRRLSEDRRVSLVMGRSQSSRSWRWCQARSSMRTLVAHADPPTPASGPQPRRLERLRGVAIGLDPLHLDVVALPGVEQGLEALSQAISSEPLRRRPLGAPGHLEPRHVLGGVAGEGVDVAPVPRVEGGRDQGEIVDVLRLGHGRESLTALPLAHRASTLSPSRGRTRRSGLGIGRIVDAATGGTGATACRRRTCSTDARQRLAWAGNRLLPCDA